MISRNRKNYYDQRKGKLEVAGNIESVQYQTSKNEIKIAKVYLRRTR